jgi:hypothetical protein
MKWLIIIGVLLGAALLMGCILYFIMFYLVRWMDEVEKKHRDEEIQ